MFHKLFRTPIPVLSQNCKKHRGRPFGSAVSQKQWRAIRDNGVPEHACLNPYGAAGNTRRARYRATFFKRTLKTSFREAAMKRTRVRMEAKRALALEAHELQQLARESAKLAMETLIEISGNKRAPEANRIAASAVILDRAYGKASQTSITANVSNGKTKDLDSTELDTRINRALKRVEELTNRAPKAGPSQKRPADLRKYN